MFTAKVAHGQALCEGRAGERSDEAAREDRRQLLVVDVRRSRKLAQPWPQLVCGDWIGFHDMPSLAFE